MNPFNNRPPCYFFVIIGTKRETKVRRWGNQPHKPKIKEPSAED